MPAAPHQAEASTLLELECSATGVKLPPTLLQNLSPAGAPLLARYDLERAASTLTRTAVRERVASIWRYHEMLPAPVRSGVVSLNEGMTPLLDAPALARRFGLRWLRIKDEGRNPLGSFKDRGMSVAISMARELGTFEVAIPSAGNAGGSAAAYAARAGLVAHVFMPADADPVNIAECERAGARLTLIDGFLDACARAAADCAEARGAFELTTFKEPYRVEGKKLMAYELVEQLYGNVPDVIVYPTGGGTGLVGIWKGLTELEGLGWIPRRRPRMVCVQASGCAPLVRAFKAGAATAAAWASPTTRVHGLRAPRVLADRLCLDAIRASGGTAVSVDDTDMWRLQREASAAEGLALAPEGGACLAALEQLLDDSAIGRDERVVVLNTASALKYTPTRAADR